jgi:acetolactate synthase-1/2/3 large subunit
MTQRNGAQLLMQTLLDNGVELVVGNPGTSEMQFVAALDSVPEIHSVLALFEGVVTGAADGYGRMADKPAATLLHLGPGLANGIANLHNARRAHTPIVNIVGEHATFHRKYDPPLNSDIESIARGATEWYRIMQSVDRVGEDVADAVGSSLEPPGRVATLVLPADIAWSEARGEPKKAARAKALRPSQAAVDEAARVLRSGEPAALLLNGRGTREAALRVRSAASESARTRASCATRSLRASSGAPAAPWSSGCPTSRR